jgi:hypothetical protein
MEGEIQQSAPAPASGFNAGYNMHPMNAPGSGGGAFEASAGSQNGEIGARRKPRRSKKRNAADRGFEIFKSVEGQNGAGGSSILNSLVGTELPDFTEAEEAELGPEFSTTFDAENSNPAAAKKPKLENYSVVYVHEGQRMRTAISNSVWNDVWHKCQTLVSDMILSRYEKKLIFSRRKQFFFALKLEAKTSSICKLLPTAFFVVTSIIRF